MKNDGQNLIEFIIIIALISFAGLICLVLLGNNVKSLFSSTAQKNSQYKPFEWNQSIVDTKTIQGYKVNSYADGSISFNVGKQNIKLNNSILNYSNQVFEATAGQGKENLIKEIAYMIKKNEAKYNGDVPLEVYFGKGTRQSTNPNYESFILGGEASLNLLTIQVGNEFVAIQNDKTCSNGSSCLGYKGEYRIEGTINSDNNFNAAVTSKAEVTDRTGGVFTGSFSKGTNDNLIFDGKYDEDAGSGNNLDFNWILNFDKSKGFNL